MYFLKWLKVYGFEGECTSKFTANLFKGFIELFNSLPLAYTIENKIFIVHGGLSEDGVTLGNYFYNNTICICNIL